MKNNRLYKFILLWSIFPVFLVYSGLTVWNLTTNIIINVIFIVSLCIVSKRTYNIAKPLAKNILIVYVALLFITLLRSFFELNGRDSIVFFSKFGGAAFVYMFVFVFQDLKNVSEFYRIYYKYAIPLFFILAYFMPVGTWGWILTPIYLTMIFYRSIPLKYRFFIVALFIMSFIDLDTRANFGRAMSFVACWILLTFNKTIPQFKSMVRATSLLLFILPIIFLILGLVGKFNIFQYTGDADDVMFADTRTLVYEETVKSALNNDYVLYGRSFAHGYDSSFEVQFMKLGNADTAERYAEVCICNIFTWMGLVGLIIYAFVIFAAIYYALFKSRNIYMMVIGLLLSTRWIVNFIEDINNIDPLNISLFMLIALCLNPRLLNMNDSEFINTMKSILIPKVRRL